MANFPTSAPNLKTDYEDNVDDVLAANQNTPNDEINKIAEKVGINGVGFNPASSSASANVVLHEDTDNGTNKITLTAPSAIASDKTITLPDETGTILTTASTISQGQLDSSYQYQIVPTVASNNLTVALKTLAGNDPSASSPVRVRIGNTIHIITSALSVTKNAGTNWCNAGSAELATKEIDYFVYLGYNATDGVVVGFSRIPFGSLYSDFSATTTNEKYCAISTITNASAGDNYVNIGRFAATLSAGTGYTWSVPTFTASNLIQRPIYETRFLSTVGNMKGSGGSLGSYTEDRVICKYKIRDNSIFYINQRRITNKGSWSGDVYMYTPFASKEAEGAFCAGTSYAQGGLTLKAIPVQINTSGIISWHNNIWIANYDWSAVANNDTFSVRAEYEI